MSGGGEVWVWVECYGKAPEKASLGLLGKASELAEQLGGRLTAAVLAGTNSDDTIQMLFDHGADRVYLPDKAPLDTFQPDVCAQFLADLAEEKKPEVVLWGATSLASETAARAAAKLETGLTAHCVDLRLEEIDGVKQLVAAVAGYGGNAIIKIICPEKRPQMATVKPGIFPTPPPRKGKGETVRVPVKEGESQLEVVEVVVEKEKGSGLERAGMVVAGGWGMSCFGGLGMAEELAQVLGGSTGGTRPAVDAGWLPHERMIGQSGVTVAPELLITLGISGAAQFTTTVLGSRYILAIDRNPKAPIFEVADLGIVGDLKEVLPQLLEKIRKAKGA